MKSAIEYVELINEEKQVVKRLALHVVLGTAYGDIAIDTAFASGTYVLRAYTNWMRNFGDSLLFQKQIRVTSAHRNRYVTSSSPRVEPVGDSVKVSMQVWLKNSLGRPLASEPARFFVVDAKGKVLYQAERNSNGDGEIPVHFFLDEKQSSQPVYVEVGRERETIEAKVPVFTQRDLDMQFLPESGHLVAGILNEVGFKAVGTDGWGKDVSGVIKDKEGTEVTSFQSVHKGMGKFSFIPEVDNHYTALLSNGQQVPLPPVENSGTTIHVVSRDSGENIYVRVASTGDLSGREYHILGSAKGFDVYRATVVLNGKTVDAAIPKAAFPTGVASFVLQNEKGQIVNQRAFFVNNHEQLNVEIEAPSQTLSVHDSIPLKITVKDKDGKAVTGSFSLAVTDDNQVKKDAAGDANILSYLLLESDLRGNIEAPGYYFSGATDTQEQALDALMLTQGFVKYNWDTTEFTFDTEPEFMIKGKVTNPFNKGVQGLNVRLIGGGKTTVYKDTVTGKDGRFTFTDFPAFDTLIFVAQASRKGGGRLGLAIDFDDVVRADPQTVRYRSGYAEVDTFIQAQVRNRAIYQEAVSKADGTLPTVTVSTYARLPLSSNLNGGGNADQVILPAQIREAGLHTTLYDMLLAKVEGLGGKNGFLLNGRLAPFILMDGRPILITPLNRGGFPMRAGLDRLLDTLKLALGSDISSIEIMSSRQLQKKYFDMFLNREQRYLATLSADPSAYYIVEVTTYSGKGSVKGTPGVDYYYPQPFYYGRSFYSPRYEVDEKSDSLPDLRSTIYWNQSVVTDEQGRAQVYFYAADTPSDYTLWLEGMDMYGSIGVGVEKIRIEGQ